jgi:hypothetical protein
MTGITPEQVREIAENAADKAAEKAVRAMLTALGVNPDKLHEEQQVWAFARTMQQGTKRGARALFTGFLTALATLIAGWLWLAFGNRHP